MSDATTAAVAATTTAADASTASATTAASTATTTAAATTTQAQAPTWPDDWRARMAGDDPKELKLAERYTDPAAVWKKARALEIKVSEGMKFSPPGADAKPEEIAAFRQQLGIPEKPDGYKVDGMSEADKPWVESFAAAAHSMHLRPDQVQGAVKWLQETHKAQTDAMAQKIEQTRASVEDSLRTEWGGDYRKNMDMAVAMVDAAPEGVAETFWNATGPDGMPLRYNPSVLKWLVGQAREINPTITLVPPGANQATGINDIITKAEERMRTDREAWLRDEAGQAQYRAALEAREKLNKRAA